MGTPKTRNEMNDVLPELGRIATEQGIENILAQGLLTAGAHRHPDKPLLLQDASSLTYGSAESDSTLIAGALQARGIGQGDQVALMGFNSFDWFKTWMAVAKVGATLVPVNTGLKGADLSYIFSNSEAKVIICDPDLEGVVLSALEQDEEKRQVFADVSQLLGSGAEPFVAGAPQTLEQPAQIMYTSGTTGPPKGIVIRRGLVGPAGFLVGSMVGVDADEILYTCFPMFHASGQATCLAGLWYGATIAIDKRFSASRFWNNLTRYQATRFNYLGGIPRILMKSPVTSEESKHRVKFCYGAAMPSDIWEDFEERFGVKVIELYSQTEGGLLYNGPDGKVGSMGTPVAGFGTAAILDDLDQECEPETVGELCFRPPEESMLPKFWNSPEEQRKRTRSGWLHTGDRARYDSDGFFYFEDREKDGLRRRGENISSWSIETAVVAHPAVLECAAYGVPSELGEEDVKVDIVLREGASLDERELIVWCSDRIADFMIPRYIQYRSQLPKTATERVQKNKLKAEGVAQSWDRDKEDPRENR